MVCVDGGGVCVCVCVRACMYVGVKHMREVVYVGQGAVVPLPSPDAEGFYFLCHFLSIAHTVPKATVPKATVPKHTVPKHTVPKHTVPKAWVVEL